MRVELICLGTELLRDKVNTNSNTIAARLQDIGLGVSQVTITGDRLEDMIPALKDALSRSKIVLVSGGLGPTFDDLTRECASEVLKRPLVFSRFILNHIRRRFASVGIPMPEENQRQAYVLRQARPILNAVGTAPGQIIDWKGKCLVLLPGPPSELIPMMDRTVCPYLKKRYSRTTSRSFVLHVFGHPESEIDERISPVVNARWDEPGTKTTFGILAHHWLIDVKVTTEGRNAVQAGKVLSKIRGRLRAILANEIFGEDEETMESAVGKMLRRRKQTLSLAESCTGGLIADKITNVPGSSDYFLEGIVTYSNESKIRILGVSKETLRKHGAVSEPAAREMVRGILRRSGSDWAVAVTGIAGPGGGTRAKPVGLVHIAVSSRDKLYLTVQKFHGSRKDVKENTALTALDLLRRRLL